MLQVSTGKFFTHEAYETFRRATLFTNYRLFGDERIVTNVGSLQPVVGIGGLHAMTCEIVERLQKIPGGPYPGEVIATGGETLIDDFAAVVSFALSITCTPDPDLARRLTAPHQPGLRMNIVPQKFIPRIFDPVVDWRRTDADLVGTFVSDLMALERKSYEGAIRAIRRFVAGTHRTSDDVNLAYSLFVMSVESLAQDFDGFVPTWDDYDAQKRSRIDAALDDAAETTKLSVRDAILESEHVALSRRFREFAISHVEPAFFRNEAVTAVGSVNRLDLSESLREAYAIRSKYVHHLRDIPALLTALPGLHETIPVEGKPTLTFAGLVRVAHHVIRTFVSRAPKTETERYDWMKDLPGRLTMDVDPSLWLGNPVGLDAASAVTYLAALMTQLAGRSLDPSARLSNMHAVLPKIEEVVPSLAKPAQRLPLLAIYFIFNFGAPEEFRSPSYPELIEKYQADFDMPSVAGLAAHLATFQNPDWTLEQMEVLHAGYLAERHHARALRLGRAFEAAFTLRLSEMHFDEVGTDRAQSLIGLAVEIFPQHQGLKDYEIAMASGQPVVKSWQDVLFAAAAPTAGQEAEAGHAPSPDDDPPEG